MDTDRRARKKAKSKLRKAARAILREKYGVDPSQLGGYPGIRKHIVQVRADLSVHNGYAILSAFTGLPPVPAKQPGQNTAQKQRKHANQLKRRQVYEATDAFLGSYEWRRVRMVVLQKHGARCQCCGATPADGVKMNVDHIKPRKLFPQLALDVDNLQVLCEVCNHGKGNWDMTDWRADPVIGEAERQHIRSILEGQ